MPDSSPIQVLREKTQQVVQRFISSDAKTRLSWSALLGFVLLGLRSAVENQGFALALGSLGFEIGSSMIWEFLKKQIHRGEPTVADAIAAVNDMGQSERQLLEDLSLQVGLLPMLLREMLVQQNADLLDEFGRLLEQWGERLGMVTVHSLLVEIRQHTARIEPLETDLAELRSQVDTLVNELRYQGKLPPRTRRVSLAAGGVTDRLITELNQELRDELDSLLQ